ncbi:hypothetical protein [Aeoliella sp.]|uniref:hypothetical protein n=1 Tax=Aeoliella sp. TaxID=2795800 RepID=UPI003CCC158F
MTVDEETLKVLSSGEIVEVVDSSGRLLGRLMSPTGELGGLKGLAGDFTEDELSTSRDYDGPGMTTNELIAHLRSIK